MASKRFLSCLLSTLLASTAIFATGCTSLKLPNLSIGAADPTFKSPDFQLTASVSEEAYHGVRQAKAQNSIVLEIVGDSTPVRVLPLPAEKAVYVSDLLEQTGVAEKLGAVEATLYRSATDSIGGLPMDVRIASDGKTVRPESDYALQAGDRLRVAKGTHPALKGLLGSVLGF